LATIVWLLAWGVLHARWRSREVASGPVFTWTVVLVVLAIIATFPPRGLLEPRQRTAPDPSATDARMCGGAQAFSNSAA
jgi:hypothetical protein